MQNPTLHGDTRQQIIDSLFNRRGPDGVLDETYIAHLKIWEDSPPGDPQLNAEGGGRKSRYLMLAVTRSGKVQLHKAKRNTNMTFSKGKTWALQDLRVVDVHGPHAFALTMTSRTYTWSTEQPRDQSQFLHTMVRIYNKFTQGRSPQLINFDFNEPPPETLNEQNPAVESRYGNLSPPNRSNLLPPTNFRDRLGSSSSIASSSISGGGKSYYTSNSPSRSQQSIGRPSEDSSRNIPEGGPYGRSPINTPLTLPVSRPADRPNHRNPSQDSTPEYRRPSGSSVPHPQQPTPDSISSEIPPVSRRKKSSDSDVRQTGGDVGMSPPQRSPYRPGGRPLSKEILHTRNLSTSSSAADGMSRSEASIPPPPPAPSRDLDPYGGMSESQTPIGLPGINVVNGSTIESDELTPRVSQQRQFLAPIITTTQPSPANSPNPDEGHPDGDRRVIVRRASFHPPPQNGPYSREVLLRGNSFPQAGQLLEADTGDDELEDATMANVEEMLEGFDFGMESGTHHQGTAEAIEARLLDELNALEAANIHAFLETDDRIGAVMTQLDEAVQELDEMDRNLSGYKMQLNVVNDDIMYIESQNKGLQVQTANQRALLAELEQLLQIVQVADEDLQALTQESLESERGIQALEVASTSLYKALLAGKDAGDMAAAMERIREYETRNRQFCLRVIEYLFIMFKFQSDLAATNATKSPDVATGGNIMAHDALEDKLGQYCGLVLYIKEMDEERYQKLCANYFSAASDLHGKEMKSCLVFHINQVKRPAEDDKDDGSFAGALATAIAKAGPLARSRTAVGHFRGQDSKKDKRSVNNMRASDAFDRALERISQQIFREQAFIADFLQITDNIITYADYMDLDSYFRRVAGRHIAKGLQPATVKLQRSALELIFGFLGKEIKDWVDGALQREQIQVFGITAACERQLQGAEARNATFLVSVLQRQLQRVQALLDRFIADQVKTIEATKLTLKKRTGVAFFIRHFPSFAARIEAQLVGCDHLSVRRTADSAYEGIVSAMFETLQQMAKLDRGDATAMEDKGQLNYFIIMIENMYFYASDTAKQDLQVLASFQERASRIYEENLLAYVKAVLRRSFSKPMDFFDSVNRQLQASAPSDVAASPTYSKAALKRVIKEAGSLKDLRKAVDALAKRVEKHFSIEEGESSGNALSALTSGTAPISADSAALIGVVWTACTKALLREVSMWQEVIAKCYADSGQALEYSSTDVEATFKKARPV